MTAAELPLALTMGDPAGIGGEIALNAWAGRSDGTAPFFVIDDPGRLADLGRRIGVMTAIKLIRSPSEANAVFPQALPVLGAALPNEAIPGQPDPANAQAVLSSIETAVRLVMSGDAGAVVTNPIHKQSLYEANFPYPGHTEYLAALAGDDITPVMMLAAGSFRVVPVTVHQSLTEALSDLNTGAITQAGLITHAALKQDFGLPHPRIAVAGLNPHAGEGGAMGSEEDQIIAPAVSALPEVGIDAFGPIAPDSLFTPQARDTYDAALCMYHDQALIPIKTVAFETAVNVTLGLPFVRTSPDHGTAFDIAGTGQASETSLLAALDMAAGMVRYRATAQAA